MKYFILFLLIFCTIHTYSFNEYVWIKGNVNGPVQAKFISDSGNLILNSIGTGYMAVQDTKTGNVLDFFDNSTIPEVNLIIGEKSFLSSDNRLLAIPVFSSIDDFLYFYIWDLDKREIIKKIKFLDGKGWSFDCCFSENSENIFVFFRNNQNPHTFVYKIDLNTGEYDVVTYYKNLGFESLKPYYKINSVLAFSGEKFYLINLGTFNIDKVYEVFGSNFNNMVDDYEYDINTGNIFVLIEGIYINSILKYDSKTNKTGIILESTDCNNICLAGNGNKLISKSNDSLLVYDLETNKPAEIIKLKDIFDDVLIFTNDNNNYIIVNVDNGFTEKLIPGSPDRYENITNIYYQIRKIIISPDNNYIAISNFLLYNDNCSISIIKNNSGELVNNYNKHTGDVSEMAFLNNNESIIFVDNKHDIIKWNFNTNEEKAILTYEDDIRNLKITGHYLTVTLNKGEVFVYNVDNWQLKYYVDRGIPTYGAFYDESINSILGYSNHEDDWNGRWVRFFRYDIDTKKTTYNDNIDYEWAWFGSPNFVKVKDKPVILTKSYYRAYLYDYKKNEMIGVFKDTNKTNILFVDISDDGKTGAFVYDYGSSIVSVWDLENNTKIEDIMVPINRISKYTHPYSIKLSRVGNYILIGYGVHILAYKKINRPVSAEEYQRQKNKLEILNSEYDPFLQIINPDHLIINKVQIYDLTGKLIKNINLNPQDQKYITISKENLLPKIYFIIVKTNLGFEQFKIINYK